MRLIDADVLRTSIEKDRDASDMPKMWYEGIEYAINHIIHAPTADVPERNVGKWIPVTERLPLVTYDKYGNHSSDPVILCMESGEIEIGFFNPVGTFESADDDGLSVIGSIHAGAVDYMHVVAWMPLPEPYKKETEDD